MRSLRDYFFITLKGIAMGAADVVPGVSGGTIAFISGIYDELIDSIDSINFSVFKTLKKEGFFAAFYKINGPFLLSLITGIGISVLSLARLFKYLLETHPILVWSFFFGLVVASIIFIAKQVSKWSVVNIIMLVVGAGVAYYITIIPAVGSSNNSPLFLILAGALAICAMILPGISGAFILLLLGAYKPALDAIHNHDFKKIAYLAIGAVVGLLSFAKILKWLFSNYRNATLAVLTGFVIGSLNKIWPWKKVIQLRLNSHDKWVSYLDYNVLPNQYDSPIIDKLTQTGIPTAYQQSDSHLFYAIVLALIGFSLILILEKVGSKKTVS